MTDPRRFGHREHLHLAWESLRRLGEEEGAAKVADYLRHYAAAHGEPERYNETMTRFWFRATAAATASSPAPEDFDAVLERHAHLLDKGLPFRHWSRERLFSADARLAWVDPDLRPLPSGF